MTSLNIHPKEDKGSEKNPFFSWGMLAHFCAFTTHGKILLMGPLGIVGVSSCEVLSIPLGRRDCLSDERCKKAHATRMQVFLQANSSINPKQQALELVFCFWGTHASSPDSTPPTFSFQGVLQAGVYSALGLLDYTEHHTLPCFWQQSFWIIPALSVTVCMHASVWTKEVYLHFAEVTFMMLSPSHVIRLPTYFIFYLFFNGPERESWLLDFLNHKSCRLNIFTRLCEKQHLRRFLPKMKIKLFPSISRPSL